MLISAGESERIRKRNTRTAMVGIHRRGVCKEKSDISVSSLRKKLAVAVPSEIPPRFYEGLRSARRNLG
jgi:hypothetical protein